MMRLTPVVKNILIINIVIFAAGALLNLPLSDLGGLRVVFSEEFAPYQFVTYMWLHGGFGHLFSNMIMLFFLAPLLESIWGSKRFLSFYLICGIGAGALFGLADFIEKYPMRTDYKSYMANPNPEAFEFFVTDYKSYFNPSYKPTLAELTSRFHDEPGNPELIRETKVIVESTFHSVSNIPMVGASGALYAILMAMFLLFPNTEVYIYFLFPVKIKYLVTILAVLDVYYELNRQPGDNVAHLAHLGGMLIAFILIKYWQKDSTRFY